MKNKNSIRIAIGTGLLLLIPLVLTLLGSGIEGDGWNWKAGDFIVMGTLLFSTGLAIDFALKKISDSKYRIMACTVIVATLLLIWVELAVGGVSQALKFFFYT